MMVTQDSLVENMRRTLKACAVAAKLMRTNRRGKVQQHSFAEQGLAKHLGFHEAEVQACKLSSIALETQALQADE